MPTIITHGVVALALAGKAHGIRVASRWRLLAACIACAMLPDADYFGFKAGIHYNSLFGHRGFTHSLFFAAIVALVIGWLFNRSVRAGLANFGKLSLLFFAVIVSHGVLDAFTNGGEGVAFFSPFSNHRYFFPYRPIMVSPLGVDAFLGMRGLLVLLNEILLVIIPFALALYLPEIRQMAKARRRIFIALAAAWLLLLILLQTLYPLNNIFMTVGNSGRPTIDLYVKQYNNTAVLSKIPTIGIPDGKVVTDFMEYQKRGLFNQRVSTEYEEQHWASGFFPSWFGGIAGRWQDSNFNLFMRTFFGYSVPNAREIQEVLKASTDSPAKKDFLFKLSPTEKYDLALGDYTFASTKSILKMTHNAAELPKYWYGICNGMAAAAKWYEEPFRTVDVINPNGFKIKFHPNDVKALLGYSQANVAEWSEIGTRCNINGPESDSCRVNAGVLLIAIMNRIALAHDAFIVDGFSGTRKQFYLLDAARVEVLSQPKPVKELPEWAVPTPVKYLAKVRLSMEFVSTLLGDKDGGQPDESGREGYYKKVGRVAVPRVLEAMIALDYNKEVIGGAWLGDEDVPDLFFFFGPSPAIDAQNRLTINTAFSWTVIKEIYEKSISNKKDPGAVDFSL